MSNKKTNYPFVLTDSRDGTNYQVVFSTLWKVEDSNIILPKSAPKPYAYAYNVFRENHGWLGGGSFVILPGRPGEQEAMQALGVVLAREEQEKTMREQLEKAAEAAAPEGDEAAEVEDTIEEITIEEITSEVPVEA